MDVDLRERAVQTTDLAAGLQRSAQLVSEGLTAFLEGNPFRGRRVKEATRHLLADLEAWQETALATWPDDEASLQQRLALSRHSEALAKTAQQLAGLAESRPATQVQAGLRDAARHLAEPLEDLLSSLADPAAPTRGLDALDAVRKRKPAFSAWCAQLGRDNPRLFSSCLLAVAAGQRIEEAAGEATQAARAAAELQGQTLPMLA